MADASAATGLKNPPGALGETLGIDDTIESLGLQVPAELPEGRWPAFPPGCPRKFVHPRDGR
jgi:hypothetical protein